MKLVKYSKLFSFLVSLALIGGTFCAQAAINWGNIKQAITNPKLPTVEQVSQGLQTAATTIEQAADTTQKALDEVGGAIESAATNIDDLAAISKSSTDGIYNNAMAIGKADSAAEIIDPLFGIISAPLAIYDSALTVLNDLNNVLDRLSKNLIQPADAAAHARVVSVVKSISDVSAKMQEISEKLHTMFPLLQSYAHRINDHGTNMVTYIKESRLSR